MCGIAGIQLNKNISASAELILNKLSQLLKHRGPDELHLMIKNNVGFAHTRLAILDLANGSQPFFLDKTSLIANAEIYNYKDLIEQFNPLDLKTNSDCELPLHAWKLVQENYTKKLRGMYAIAIYDETTGQLILSRDPFGIKPLYYATVTDGIAFASEPQALIKSGLSSKKINTQARAMSLYTNF